DHQDRRQAAGYDSAVSARRSSALSEALAMVAPGRPLREGLDRILQAKRGGLVVVGDEPAVLSICSGGFLLDAEFSPQRLSELAKMDGAIILAPDASRIARANVHLMPKASIPTTETGTRHRTAERVARSIDVPVLSVSAAMALIAVYRHDQKHTLQPIGWLVDRADQGLSTLQRFRVRFDVALTSLSTLEVEDTVSVHDVVAVMQSAEMVARIAKEVSGHLVELGEDGRLVRLQLAELVESVAPTLRLVLRDYLRQPADGSSVREPAVDMAVQHLNELTATDLVDVRTVAEVLNLPAALADPHAGVEPRGYRLLHRLPRFSDAIIERIVDRFLNLQQIMRASLSDLEKVEGVGVAKARSVKDGLARLAEASILERYQ
ncbi:MAG: DNA integrity scanning diadenylate cyclase DisA, partial [Acidimicrobiales bacterium]